MMRNSRNSTAILAVLVVLLLLVLLGSWYHASPSEPSKCFGIECIKTALFSSKGAITKKPLIEVSTDDWNNKHMAKNGTSSSKYAANVPNSTLSFRLPDNLHQVITALYDYLEKPQTQLCQKFVRVGGQPFYQWKKFDGFKWMCLDPRLQLLTTDRCLIYSFGVDHDWSFDDQAQLLQCEIHAFDPSLGQSDYKRSDRITFHDIGIGDKDENRNVKGRLWHMLTYGSILRRLGHLDHTIHYLKVDVEGAEWPMFEQIVRETPRLLNNVLQIGMEIHMSLAEVEKTWRQYLQTMISLEQMGFRLFHAEFNPFAPLRKHFSWSPKLVSSVYELVWIKF